jgi:hypothetical protein
MDLDKAENKIKENTKPDIPSIAVALAAAPTVPAVAPITPAAAPPDLVVTPVSTRTATPRLLS